ncbi:MAG: hypothetical protein ACE37K_07160 [Planctomycetota bacterium]
MTKSETYPDTTASREPRPFLYLEPAAPSSPGRGPDARGVAELQRAFEPRLPHVVRSVVDRTIARHNEKALRPQPIQLSVLNRRRRAARSWLLTICEGRADASTCHQAATQWLPLLCGTGPDRLGMEAPARALVEYVRGAITACIFDEASESLLPQARALHALESTLAAHLAAVLAVSPGPVQTV